MQDRNWIAEIEKKKVKARTSLAAAIGRTPGGSSSNRARNRIRLWTGGVPWQRSSRITHPPGKQRHGKIMARFLHGLRVAFAG